MQTATGTIEDALRERHLLAMSTGTACLRGVGRVDFESHSSSFFRFGEQLSKELRPCCIADALCQTMVMGHTVDMQVFYRNDPEAVDDLSAFLMGEIPSSESDALMHASHGLPVLASFRSPLRQFAMLALHFGKGLFFLAEEAGIVDLSSLREGGEGFQTNVYSYLSRVLRKSFGFTLDREGSIPLASTALANGEGFDLACDRAVRDQLDGSHFGDNHTIIMGEAETGLWEREAIVAIFATEARIAGLLTGFDPSEKGFEGEIDAHRDILQDLRMDDLERRVF